VILGRQVQVQNPDKDELRPVHRRRELFGAGWDQRASAAIPRSSALTACAGASTCSATRSWPASLLRRGASWPGSPTTGPMARSARSSAWRETVKDYVSSILSELEVARRAEAAAYLARHTTQPGSG
jgi:hypothetical protein